MSTLLAVWVAVVAQITPEATLFVLGFDILHNGIRVAVGSHEKNKVVAFMKGVTIGVCEFGAKLAAATTPYDETLPLIKLTHNTCASIGDNLQFNRRPLERLAYDFGLGSVKFENFKPFLSINLLGVYSNAQYYNRGMHLDWKASIYHMTPVYLGDPGMSACHAKHGSYVDGCNSHGVIYVSNAIPNDNSTLLHEYIHSLNFQEGRWLEELLHTDQNRDTMEHFDLYTILYLETITLPVALILRTGKIPNKYNLTEINAYGFQGIYDLTHP